MKQKCPSPDVLLSLFHCMIVRIMTQEEAHRSEREREGIRLRLTHCKGKSRAPWGELPAEPMS